ncbi:MAG: DUF3224 domain-containing protein [Bacteroidota bacterium]
MPTAISSFEVTRWDPAESDSPEAGPALSRITIGKTFTGDFEGTGLGDGLFCGMEEPGNGAGYLVSERLIGQLEGRSGSFVIQHGGLIGPGVPPTTFGNVVPGSGTGELAGLSGTVEISEGHTFTLTYALAASGS